MVVLVVGLVCLSFVACALFVLPARLLATRLSLVDNPDFHRKLHRRPTPLAGGMALLATLWCVAQAWLWFGPAWTDQWISGGLHQSALLIACTVMCVVGLIDDRYGMRGRHKLMGQLLATLVVIGGGLSVDSLRIFGFSVQLGVLEAPLTVLWLLAIINACNLLDGMDGMLGTVGVVAAAGLAGLAYFNGQWLTLMWCLIMAGGLAGFLCYNLPKAVIFLGDGGSLVIGLLLGVLSLRASMTATGSVDVVYPLAVLVLPLMDTCAALARRRLTGRSIYTPDRAHLHHCLMQQHRPWEVLQIVALLGGWSAAVAVTGCVLQREWLAWVGGLSVVVTFIVQRWFGHAEWQLLRERLMQNAGRVMRRGVTAGDEEITVHLQGSADWPRLWRDLRSFGENFNLERICLDVNLPSRQESFHAVWQHESSLMAERPLWQFELPLIRDDRTIGRVEVGGFADSKDWPAQVAGLARELQEQVALLTQSTDPVLDPDLDPLEDARSSEPLSWSSSSSPSGL